jgi:signal transduction histidine kinase
MMRDSLDEEIATIQSELRQLVENRLSVLFAEITERFTTENLSEIKRSAEQLRESIDLVVRPLSKELALDQSEIKASSDRFKDKDVYLAEFLARKVPRRKDISVSVRQLISLPFILLPSAVFIVPALSYVFGVGGALRGIATLVMLGVVLLVVRRIAGKYSGRPAGMMPISTAGIALVTFLVSSMIWGIQSPLQGPLAITICVALIFLGQMLLKYFQLRRSMTISESEETNSAIDLLLSRLRQEVWVIRKKLAQVVHGQVQSRLLAASMRLSQNEHLDAETLERAKSDIVAAMSAVATDLSEKEESFTDQFQRIQDAWDGVCEVTLTSTPEVILLLELDSLARTCVAEVISEAVANAAKHSQAARVDITLTHNPAGFIDVTITTTGELEVQGAGHSGYGSRILDELTTSWERSSSQGLITLTAQIALDPVQA